MTLSVLEQTIATLGEDFAERTGVAVPFMFGRTELFSLANKGLTSICWVPTSGAIQKSTGNGETGKVEKPRAEKRQTLLAICWDTTRAGAEVLHNSLIDLLTDGPLNAEFGEFEWESEAVEHAAPNLSGVSIAQEITLTIQIPRNPDGGTTLWTVLHVDHGDALILPDGSEEEQHTITEL